MSSTALDCSQAVVFEVKILGARVDPLLRSARRPDCLVDAGRVPERVAHLLSRHSDDYASGDHRCLDVRRPAFRDDGIAARPFASIRGGTFVPFTLQRCCALSILSSSPFSFEVFEGL